MSGTADGAASKGRKCPLCWRKVRGDWKYCWKCGRYIRGQMESSGYLTPEMCRKQTERDVIDVKGPFIRRG